MLIPVQLSHYLIQHGVLRLLIIFCPRHVCSRKYRLLVLLLGLLEDGLGGRFLLIEQSGVELLLSIIDFLLLLPFLVVLVHLLGKGTIKGGVLRLILSLHRTLSLLKCGFKVGQKLSEAAL